MTVRIKHEPHSYSCRACESSTNEKIEKLEKKILDLQETLKKYTIEWNFFTDNKGIWELSDNGECVETQPFGTWARKILMAEVKVGQVYFYPKINAKLVITFVDDENCSWVTEEWKVGIIGKGWLESCTLEVEYPTWQEAIKWEFKK